MYTDGALYCPLLNFQTVFNCTLAVYMPRICSNVNTKTLKNFSHLISTNCMIHNDYQNTFVYLQLTFFYKKLELEIIMLCLLHTYVELCIYLLAMVSLFHAVIYQVILKIIMLDGNFGTFCNSDCASTFLIFFDFKNWDY